MTMEFRDILNNFIKETHCTAKDLSNESGLSESLISRFRKGEKTPKYNSKQYNQLISGLKKIAGEKKNKLQ